MENWFRLYVVMLCICAVCEMLMPKGKFEKAVRGTLAFVFTAAVFLPLLETFAKEDFFSVLIKNVSSYSASYTYEENAGYKSGYELLVETDYKLRLSEALMAEYEKNGIGGIKEININVNGDSSAEAFGAIQKIEIVCFDEALNENMLIFIAINFYSLNDVNIDILYEPSEGGYD